MTGLTYFGGSGGSIFTTTIFIFGIEELDALEVLYNHSCRMAYKIRSAPSMCSLMKILYFYYYTCNDAFTVTIENSSAVLIVIY